MSLWCMCLSVWIFLEQIVYIYLWISKIIWENFFLYIVEVCFASFIQVGQRSRSQGQGRGVWHFLVFARLKVSLKFTCFHLQVFNSWLHNAKFEWPWKEWLLKTLWVEAEILVTLSKVEIVVLATFVISRMMHLSLYSAKCCFEKNKGNIDMLPLFRVFYWVFFFGGGESRVLRHINSISVI